VDQVHLVNLNPFPADLGEVLSRYKKVLVPEVNLGQLSRLLRAEYLVDAIPFTQVQGVPFRAVAMEAAILQQIDGTAERYAALEDLPSGGTDPTANESTDTRAQS
jgi:2-oxoglutarate ferredoxin oxidoreductase subunit alpha